MVGIPKSKGCQLCRSRSVKCDETRPSCLQCTKGGRECPGYSRETKFVDEALRLRWKVSQPSSGKPTCIKTRGTLKPPSFKSGSLELAQTVSCCISELFPLHHMTLQLSILGSWLWYVPKRLGNNMVLDSAARALSLAHFARLSMQEAATINSLESYSQALTSLSKALNRPDTRYSSEIVAATMLLGLFESFVGMENTSWIKHAGGTGALLQVRGAHLHESEFDYYMFLACRGPIISGALMSGTSCYLDSPEWMALSAYNSKLFPSKRKSFQQYGLDPRPNENVFVS
ncbi:uncharacterized protein LY89DRAFT_36969 [Mollisia scopiformis]|uniref:Zn(2)-C6 fungal-type domain-containing protein n=1 Tax=Mollisia scopiformis TaxID=149040 RepID=A0A194XD22_MOLSC|nr:uncharacterized protein LY89DRAFT_36969 [Mollisia scopiformis]KUJ18075.1 hypothetical protein LY89DRAFT_36969 [Mollisia scopiformis]